MGEREKHRNPLHVWHQCWPDGVPGHTSIWRGQNTNATVSTPLSKHWPLYRGHFHSTRLQGILEGIDAAMRETNIDFSPVLDCLWGDHEKDGIKNLNVISYERWLQIILLLKHSCWIEKLKRCFLDLQILSIEFFLLHVGFMEGVRSVLLER